MAEGEGKKNDLIEVAALWLNESNSGNKYLSGYFGQARLLVFKNTHKKEGSKEPDYRVFIAPKDKPERKSEESPPDEDAPF